MKKFFLMLVCAMIMVACGNNAPAEKVHVKDVQIEQKDGKPYVSYNGEAFTGDLYTSTDACAMEIKDGHPTYIQKIFHENGTIGVEGRQSQFKYYDEQGNKMSASEYQAKYGEEMAKAAAGSYYEFNDLN